jgi:hypothetical protein
MCREQLLFFVRDWNSGEKGFHAVGKFTPGEKHPVTASFTFQSNISA